MSTLTHPPTAHVGPRPSASRTTGTGRWLTATVALLVVALLALAGWVVYEQWFSPESDAATTMDTSAAAWSSFDRAALEDVYTKSVVFHWADGTTTVGLPALTSEIASLQGFGYSVERVSDVIQEGEFSTAYVEYSSTQGSGLTLAVMQIVDGKIAEQWSFELPATGTS